MYLKEKKSPNIFAKSLCYGRESAILCRKESFSSRRNKNSNLLVQIKHLNLFYIIL